MMSIVGPRASGQSMWILIRDTYQGIFILDTYVRVECIPSNLRVRFAPVGTLGEFEKRGGRVAHPTREGDVDMEYKELLFPRQGYILFFHVVAEGTDPASDADGRSRSEPLLGEPEGADAAGPTSVAESLSR